MQIHRNLLVPVIPCSGCSDMFHFEMTKDEVCQYFGKKWKRHRSRLKKCLLVAIEEHDRENGSGEKMEMEFDEAAPPPG